ncbi:MAG: ISNCY family transposase, partial [SAR324 cluster bacterium]|nr:ISNCY family transposase [SAR324 cluster bacterium]
MTPNPKTFIKSENFIILTEPDTEFEKYLSEAYQLTQREPKILEMIEQDLQKEALKQKKKRLDDQQWLDSQTPLLADIEEMKSSEISAETLKLQTGCPRMTPEVVFIFLMIRGYLGGIKSQVSQIFLRESMTVRLFLIHRGIKMPGMSTILDNINGVS